MAMPAGAASAGTFHCRTYNASHRAPQASPRVALEPCGRDLPPRPDTVSATGPPPHPRPPLAASIHQVEFDARRGMLCDCLVDGCKKHTLERVEYQEGEVGEGRPAITQVSGLVTVGAAVGRSGAGLQHPTFDAGLRWLVGACLLRTWLLRSRPDYEVLPWYTIVCILVWFAHPLLSRSLDPAGEVGQLYRIQSWTGRFGRRGGGGSRPVHWFQGRCHPMHVQGGYHGKGLSVYVSQRSSMAWRAWRGVAFYGFETGRASDPSKSSTHTHTHTHTPTSTRTLPDLRQRADAVPALR
jgi:hypothetical protein